MENPKDERGADEDRPEPELPPVKPPEGTPIEFSKPGDEPGKPGDEQGNSGDEQVDPADEPGQPGAGSNGTRVVLPAAAGLVLLSVIVLGVLFATGILGGSDDTPDLRDLNSDEVAFVADVPDSVGSITKSDFDVAFAQTWKRAGLKAAPKSDDAQYEQIREAAVNDLLDRAWLTGEAKELGVEAGDSEIQSELKTVKKEQFPNAKAFKKFLKDSGFSEKDVLDRVRLQVLSTKIQSKITDSIKTVSDEQVEDFYNENKKSFTTPASKGKPKKVQPLDEVREQIEQQLLPTLQQDAMTDFVKEYNERWTARTLCADEYVVSRCSNHAAADEPDDAEKPDESAAEGSESSDAGSKPKIGASDDPAPAKLEIEDVKEGTGPAAKDGDEVSVQYVGALYDTGEEFDASWDRGEPFDFTLGSGMVIKGWDQGVAGMKAGGRRKLTIPPDLAYGKAGQPPTIPENATLVFVVDLLKIK